MTDPPPPTTPACNNPRRLRLSSCDPRLSPAGAHRSTALMDPPRPDRQARRQAWLVVGHRPSSARDRRIRMKPARGDKATVIIKAPNSKKKAI